MKIFVYCFVVFDMSEYENCVDLQMTLEAASYRLTFGSVLILASELQ